MPPPCQTCYFHKSLKLTKFCTSKQCTLPLCQKCEPVHINEHQKARTQPQIMFIQTAHDQAVRQLQQQLMFTRTSKSEIGKNLKLQKEQMISIINQYFIQKQQNLNDFFSNKSAQCQKIEQKIKKIKRGSLKTMIFFFAQNNQLKETLKKINKDSQIYDQNILKQLESILKCKSDANSYRKSYKGKQSIYEQNVRKSLSGSKDFRNQSSLQKKNKQTEGSSSLTKRVPQFIKNISSHVQNEKSSIDQLKIPSSQNLKSVKNNAQSQRINYGVQIKQKKYYNELKQAIQTRNQPQSESLLPPKRNIFTDDKQNRSKSFQDKQSVHISYVQPQPIKYPSFLKRQHQIHKNTDSFKILQRERFRTQNSFQTDMNDRVAQIRNKHKSTTKIVDKSLNIEKLNQRNNDIQTKYRQNYRHGQTKSRVQADSQTVPISKEYGKQNHLNLDRKFVAQVNKQNKHILPLREGQLQKKRQFLQAQAKQKLIVGKRFSYNISNSNNEDTKQLSPSKWARNSSSYQEKLQSSIKKNLIKIGQIQATLGQKSDNKRYQSQKRELKAQPLLEKSQNCTPYYRQHMAKQIKTPQMSYSNWSSNKQWVSSKKNMSLGQQSKYSSQWQHSKNSIVDILNSPSRQKCVLESK